jgi:hypothetical protein
LTRTQATRPQKGKVCRADKALGLDRKITRRDFLNAALLASGGALLNSASPATIGRAMYLSPAPGFFFGKDGKPAPGEVLRAAPFGRIAFANTDLSGVADHRSSIIEADRAVGQLLDQVLT